MFSCEKEIELKVPPHEPGLVLNSLFEQGYHITVHLSESKLITDTLTSLGSGVSVLLKHNNSSEKLTYSGSGKYESENILAHSGEEYTVEAEHEGYNKIVATDIVPAKTPFKIINFIPEAGIDEYGDLYSEIDIEFNDNPDVTNYYEIGLMSYIGGSEEYHTDGRWDLGWIYSEDPYVLNEGDKNYWYQNILLRDEMFNGKTVRLKCTTQYQKEHDTKFRIHFRCVSENYYKYKKKWIRHYANQVTDIWDGTGNPVILFSNIENGYGIFAAFTEQQITINISEW